MRVYIIVWGVMHQKIVFNDCGSLFIIIIDGCWGVGNWGFLGFPGLHFPGTVDTAERFLK